MSDRSRRRVLGLAYVAGIIIALAIFGVFVTSSLQQNDAYSSIWSGVAALVTGWVGVVTYLRRGRPQPKPNDAAEALVHSLLAYWEPELRSRRQRFTDEPRTIPLEWTDASATFGTGPTSVIGAPDSGNVRLKLDGRLKENPDAAARELAKRFTQLPGKQRLVVLGEPGAGKTFLAITLTIGLLRQWAPGKPIAMFLSLASWDPVVESLDDWLVRRIAAQYYGGQKQNAQMLLDHQLLIPVLDGLDELPEHVRRLAVTRINHTLDGDRPTVLTCRTIEYKDNLVGGAPALLRAPVVQVQPVAMADIQSYLRQVPAWRDLAQHVRLRPRGPIAQALSTPLMLSLFAVAYKDRDPVDLLQNKSLTTRHEAEDYLVDTLLDTAYPKEGRRYFDWTSKKAKRWLTYLAKHLHEHNTRELSPWQLAREVLTPGLIPAVAVVPLLAYTAFGSAEAVVVFPMVGVIFGAAAIANNRRVPGRDAGKDPNRPSETLTVGVVYGSWSVMTAGVFFLLDFLTSGMGYHAIVEFSELIGAVVGAAVAVGLGLGLNEILVARLFARRNAKNNGRDFLVQDRVSSLVTSVATAVFVGFVAVPLGTVLTAVGTFVGQRIAVLAGEPAVVAPRLPSLNISWTGQDGLIATSLWFALVFAFAVLGTRTWTWLVVLRFVLGVTGNLPWRQVTFLEDARRRGILRGSGGSYQFGHVLLEERIIAAAMADKVKPDRRKVRRAVAAVGVVVLLAGLVSVWAANPTGCRSTGSSAVDGRMVRMVADGDSGCFAFLADDDWDMLRRGPGSASKLDEIRAMQPAADFVGLPVFVTGELDRFDEAQWPAVLDGIVAAQQILQNSVRIEFVYADLGSVRGPDAAYLTAGYIESIREGSIGGASLNIDIADSLVGSEPVDVVGLQAKDLNSPLADATNRYAKNWLTSNGTGLDPRSLANGVSESECDSLAVSSRSYATNRFDLRGAENAGDLLGKIANCGSASVLIDSVSARKLDDRQLKLFALDILRVESVPDSILPACQRFLGADPPQETLASCVATSTAARLAGSPLIDVRAERGV